ncbi:MAG: hypothetical protein LBS27_00650 [Bifidobacteriaceae bacterium]|nr:hypothetical protein [Bifidobacteriaceae bacterium]
MKRRQAKRARRRRGSGQPVLSFARIDAESSILRWHLGRHGDAILAHFPSFLTRLAQGPAAVALIFDGDQVVGLAAWRPTEAEEGVAELLALHACGPDLAAAELAAFAHGPDGPLVGAGITTVWAVADAKGQAKLLQEAGYGLDQETPPARPSLARWSRPTA